MNQAARSLSALGLAGQGPQPGQPAKRSGWLGKRPGTGERAEEVGHVFVYEAARRVVRIDDHLADGVNRKPVVTGVALADGSHELHGLANVAERLAAARFVEDGVDVGC